MPEHNDYNPVARLYDVYLNVDFDIQYFVDCAADYSGPILELMAGTGRVSKALAQAGADLTCIDISGKMLQVLQAKLLNDARAPRLVCADVRWLPLVRQFELAIIPFNSFSEITSRRDREKTLSEIRRVLVEGGRLICTLHNPAVRSNTLDNKNRLLGIYDLFDGNQLELWVQGGLVSGTDLAYSRQTYRFLDAAGGQVDKDIQEVRFALIGQAEFESMAIEAGFDIVSLVGDYEGSELKEDSPFMIWTLEKQAPTNF